MRRRALVAVVLAALGSACGLHGKFPDGPHSPAEERAALRAAFMVPGVAEATPRAPIGLTTSDGSGLAISSLSARSRVYGPLVETELHLTFKNPEARVREGRFRIALPQHAFVSRLAMKIDGRMREADVTEIARAREVYDEIVHRRRDPLLVEQRGTNELSARVFPINPSEEKEIIVGWVAEVSQELPVTIPLKGLPSIGRLAVSVSDSVGSLVDLDAKATVPTDDVRVVPRPESSGVRAGELFIARVTVPASEGTATPIGPGLVVLVDSSASRAEGFEGDISRVREVIAALAESEPNAHVTVAAFDQSVEVAYRGRLAGFGAEAMTRLREHGALGASDLGGALQWAAAEARATGATRALLLGDGLATAGSAGAAQMRAAATTLREAGVTRLDAIAEGDVRDEGTLRALAIGALPSDGVVADASSSSWSSRSVASRLLRSVRASVPVAVTGARWVWPTSLAGVQPGEERHVYAEVPSGVAPRVRIDGQDVPIDIAKAPPALTDKALAKARVDSLVAQGDRDGYTDALRASVVKLSKTKRVPSPFTSFLVVESEEDRKALFAPPVKPTAPKPAAPAVAFALTPAPVAPAAPPPSPEPAVAAPVPVPVPDLAPAPSPSPAPSPAPPPPRAPDGDFFAPAPPILPPTSGAGRLAPPVVGHVVKAPSIRVGTCQVNGRLPPESVRRVIRQSFGRFRACYDDGVRRRGPSLAGRVSTKFVIRRDGSVSDVINMSSEIADEKVVACITKAFSSLAFPEPEGGIVTVVYPLMLQPNAVEADEATKDPGLRSPLQHGYWVPQGFRHEEPPPPPPLPWFGDYAEVREAFDRSDVKEAFAIASAARVHDPRDILALLALGEAYEAAHLPDLAARAYGSIADLRPNDVEALRIAAARLEHVETGALPLAVELSRRAAEDRPDHPSGRHAYAMALLRSGTHEQAFNALASAIATQYATRFQNARLVLEDDLAIVAAAWSAAEPSRAKAIAARTAALTGRQRIDGPSVSLVLSWETDTSDLDLFVRDASPGATATASETGAPPPLVGSQRASASDGFGPEAVVLQGERGVRPTGRLAVRLNRKGPMGHVMGVVDVISHDGRGNVSVSARPFVAMTEGAEVDLGAIE